MRAYSSWTLPDTVCWLSTQAAQLGAAFTVARTDLTWSRIERQKGVYNFTGPRGLAAQLKAAGVRPWFVVDYGNSLYTPGGGPPVKPAAVAAFANYTINAVRALAPYGCIFEIWNEPNNPSFTVSLLHGPKVYAALATAVKVSRAALKPARSHLSHSRSDGQHD